MDLRLIPFDRTSISKSDITHVNADGDKTLRFDNAEPPVEPVVMNPKKKAVHQLSIKYGECMRNHAASIGGHASDGCGEFMPRGGDLLTCGVCGCHRNFHRREVLGGEQQHHYPLHSPPPLLLYNAGPTKAPTIGTHHFRNGTFEGRVISSVLRDQYHEVVNDYDRRSETPEGREEVNVMGSTMRGKRFRTKFTQEQKDRMFAFAEKIGWRIQRHDDVALNQFCSEVGVKRNVLKVWMHNNKNAHRRREAPQPEPQSPQLPPPPRIEPVVA